MGWLVAIIIGGLAGWLADRFMKSNFGLLIDIVLGVVGAVVARVLPGIVGISFSGVIGYLIAAFIGACILIAVVHAIKRG